MNVVFAVCCLVWAMATTVVLCNWNCCSLVNRVTNLAVLSCVLSLVGHLCTMLLVNVGSHAEHNDAGFAGTSNVGNSNTGTGNVGDNNSGSNNVGRCLSGTGMTGTGSC